ncbi:MAG: cyclic nucleotide-binding domain-containing protein [Planctomycetota bacterium]|nr:cyclic nucleotide-binding domain-containing protein [Planctomycetota bacterium]
MISDQIPDIPIFQDLSRIQIDDLSEWLERGVFPKGHVFFKEGSQPDGMYVLAKGKVEVLKSTANGHTVLTELTGPSVFGEMCLLSRDPRSASLVANTEVIVGRLPLSVYDAKIAAGHLTAYRLAMNVGRIATHRLRWALDRLIELSHTPEDLTVSRERLVEVTRRLSGIYKAVKKEDES